MTVLVIVLAVALLVLLVQLIRYRKELRCMAQFLEQRDRTSNASLKVLLRSRSSMRLADAINKELDEQRAERRENQKRQRDLQVSLAHLSHDIRTPLTGARGYVQLLGDEDNAETRSRYHHAVARRLDDLNQMLNQLFMFTQVNDQEYQLELDHVDAHEVLSQTLLSFYPDFQKKGVEPLVDLDPEGCLVLANAEALSRIMQNLILNSLRHGTGSLTIKQEGMSLIFSNTVSDPGAFDVNRLFERFYKGNSDRGSQGSGLGLAIVAQLAEAMDFSVEATMQGDQLSVSLSQKGIAC